MIISRINGFTYVQTKFDYATSELTIVNETAYSDGERSKVRCYGADDVREGVAIMHKENVGVSITGTPPTPPASSIPLPALIKRSAGNRARSTSPWPPAAAPAARCTRTTWPPAPPATA